MQIILRNDDPFLYRSGIYSLFPTERGFTVFDFWRNTTNHLFTFHNLNGLPELELHKIIDLDWHSKYYVSYDFFIPETKALSYLRRYNLRCEELLTHKEQPVRSLMAHLLNNEK